MFWNDREFEWFLSAMKVNTALVDGYFWRSGDTVTTFQFRRQLSKEMMENTIDIDANDNGRP